MFLDLDCDSFSGLSVARSPWAHSTCVGQNEKDASADVVLLNSAGTRLVLAQNPTVSVSRCSRAIRWTHGENPTDCPLEMPPC